MQIQSSFVQISKSAQTDAGRMHCQKPTLSVASAEWTICNQGIRWSCGLYFDCCYLHNFFCFLPLKEHNMETQQVSRICAAFPTSLWLQLDDWWQVCCAMNESLRMLQNLLIVGLCMMAAPAVAGPARTASCPVFLNTLQTESNASFPLIVWGSIWTAA